MQSADIPIILISHERDVHQPQQLLYTPVTKEDIL